MKTVPLNVRIPIKLRDKLELEAQNDNLTLSDSVRDILHSHCSEIELNYQELIDASKTVKYTSYDFIILVAWLFDKRFNQYDSIEDNTLENFKEVILKILKDEYYPDSLKKELEKVLVDIIRYKNEFHNPNRYFQFGLPDHPAAFNYKLLMTYIYSQGFSCQSI